jgi:signal transduction histidine kinase
MPELASGFAELIAQRFIDEHRALAARWLDRLRELVPVTADEIFPSPSLLDHIPELITRIGEYIGGHDREDIAADSAVVSKARELGALRHAQHASVHQILQEYDLLDGVLITFVKEESARASLRPSPAECVDVTHLVNRSIAVLRRSTIETFLNHYTDTITAQSQHIERFHRLLSHELRQPVGVVSTAAHMLKEHPAARTDDKFEVLSRNVDRIIDITRQLEQIAHIGPTRDNPVTQEVNLTSAINGAARQLREMAESRQIDVRIAPDLPTITTDVARLELVLVNLLSNAIKYSDPAKTGRFVEASGAPACPGKCAFTIRDNGIGVPQDRIEEIFGQFVRAHSERDGELGVRGMGLGLSIVRECLDAIGGTITAESVEGRGTTFTVTLPLTV